MFGVAHDRANSSPSKANWDAHPTDAAPNYTFGHVACTGGAALATVMAYYDTGYCGSSSFTWYNRFADPALVFPGTATAMGSVAPVSYTPAITDNDLLLRDAYDAKRIRETSSVLAAYRASSVTLAAATITAPTSGASLWPSGASTTFSWSSAGAGSQYVLEIGDLHSRTFSTTVLPSTSTSVPNQVSLAGKPVIARLWTRGSGATGWTWREFRFNTANRVTSCADEAVAAGLSSTYGTSSCALGGSAVCDYDAAAHEITCDMSGASGSTSGVGVLMGAPTGSARWYDLAWMGRGENGALFCCLVSDVADAITDVSIVGTPNVDVITFAPTGYPADNWRTGMTFDLLAGDGNDVIIGSPSGGGYLEQLRGGNGGDAIAGGDGVDVLVGGSGPDDLYGQGDGDALIGKLHLDELYGGPDFDLLCEDDRQSYLLGEDAYNSSELTMLYIAQGATGSYASGSAGNTGTVYCGHSTHGSGMLDCDSTTLTVPPGYCADFMSP